MPNIKSIRLGADVTTNSELPRWMRCLGTRSCGRVAGCRLFTYPRGRALGYFVNLRPESLPGARLSMLLRGIALTRYATLRPSTGVLLRAKWLARRVVDEVQLAAGRACYRRVTVFLILWHVGQPMLHVQAGARAFE